MTKPSRQLASMYNPSQLQVMLDTYTDGADVPDRTATEVQQRVEVIRELLGKQNPAIR